MKRLLAAVRNFLREQPERVYRQEVFFAARTQAYFCSECDTIGADARQCPRCKSTAVLNLARVLPAHADSIHLVA